MRTNDEIKEIVEAAFRLLRCVAQVFDYGEKLRFKVFDKNDKGIVEIPRLVMRSLRDDSELRDVLAQARERVVEKGFQVDPWGLR